jgi:hypothetical protein
MGSFQRQAYHKLAINSEGHFIEALCFAMTGPTMTASFPEKNIKSFKDKSFL